MIGNASFSITLHLLWLPLKLPLSTASAWWSCSSTGCARLTFGTWVRRIPQLDRIADSSLDALQSWVDFVLPYIKCELESCGLWGFGTLHCHLSSFQQFLQWEGLFRELWNRSPHPVGCSQNKASDLKLGIPCIHNHCERTLDQFSACPPVPLGGRIEELHRLPRFDLTYPSFSNFLT